MNLVRALVLMIVGIAGLAYLWGGLETLSLADDPACHGPDGAFVRVVDANGDLRDVEAGTEGRCVAVDAQEGVADALGQEVDIGEGLTLPDGYAWASDGYELAGESWAGRILAGGELAPLAGLLVLVTVAVLTWQEYLT